MKAYYPSAGATWWTLLLHRCCWPASASCPRSGSAIQTCSPGAVASVHHVNAWLHPDRFDSCGCSVAIHHHTPPARKAAVRSKPAAQARWRLLGVSASGVFVFSVPIKLRSAPLRADSELCALVSALLNPKHQTSPTPTPQVAAGQGRSGQHLQHAAHRAAVLPIYPHAGGAAPAAAGHRR